MKNRWIARILALTMLIMLLTPAMGGALADNTPMTVTLKIGVKDTYQITGSSIAGAEGQTLAYKSKNSRIASVNGSGLITAKKTGKTQIYVGYGKTVLAVCTVKVMKAPSKVTLSEKQVVLSAGETKQLKATFPKNTYGRVKFTSSNEEAVKVDEDTGMLTGVAAGKGTAVITAETYNHKTATCKVAVLSGNAPTELKAGVSALGLQVGETYTLKPAVNEGADAVYSFSSSNKKVATVSAEGVVTGVKKGSAKITVKTHNGLKQTVAVKVTKKLSLKELNALLTNSQDTFTANATSMGLTLDNDPAYTGVMYYDSQMAYVMSANTCSVTLNTDKTPKYTLEGIHVGMSVEQAGALLVAGNWSASEKTVSDGSETYVFISKTDPKRAMRVSTLDGTSILNIEADLTW